MSKIKKALLQDGDSEHLDTHEGSGNKEEKFFASKKEKFYRKAERQYLVDMNISVENIEGIKLQTTAEEILRGVYLLHTIGNEHLEHGIFTYVSDGNTFVRCEIQPNSETVLRLKSYLASQQVDIGTFDNGNPKVDSSLTGSDIRAMDDLAEYLNRDDCIINNQGQVRYYRNPKSETTNNQGQIMVSYAYGATQSPYTSRSEIFSQTSPPTSLGETDFYTNYINAKSEGEVLTDPTTGNRYYENNDFHEVKFEGDNHWNLFRFIIEPHLKNFRIPKKQGLLNATHDLYKYFLYLENGNRDSAREKTISIIDGYVKPIVFSKFDSRLSKLYGRDERFFGLGMNVFGNDANATIPGEMLYHNQDIYLGKKTGRLVKKSELLEMLTEYNIVVRQKTPEEAHTISLFVINKEIQAYQNAYEEFKSRPISKEPIVLQEGEYPTNFHEMDPQKQQDRISKNPDKVRRVADSFSSRAEKRKALREMKFMRFPDQ